MPRGVYIRTKNVPCSEEKKAKIAASLHGKKHTLERRKASSRGHAGHVHSAEHRQAISVGVKQAMQRSDVKERHLSGLQMALEKTKDGRFFKGGKGQIPSQIVLDFAAILCPLGYLMDKITILKGPGMNAGHYTLDFGHPDAKVNIEIDGSSHRYKKDTDDARDALLRSLGWKVIRIKV